MKYRQEIDGLRAIAVLPVILFHAGFNAFSGGFVGVDVFFVISGFLITSLILEERAGGSFSLQRFYERRARRILPALYLMLIVCVPLALTLMMPDETEDFFGSLMAVVFFVSNLWMWQHTGYFQPAAEDNPLLHTWSLGVEEQYYLLFPLLVLGLWRFGPRVVIASVAGLSLASLGIAEIGWRHWPDANFFLLSSRAWELGAGSLVALAMFRRGRPQGAMAEIGAALGLAAIVAAVFLFDPHTPFPSLWALVPVLGAAAFLGSAQGTLTARLLGLAPFRLIGLVSYSAYLWHQPIFAFARIGLESAPGHKVMGLLVLATFVIAVLSWRFVEQPLRHPERIRTPIRMAWASGALVAVALLLPATSRPLSSYPDLERELLTPRDARTAYVLAPYSANQGVDYRGKGGRRVLVIGDSHALDFLNMAHEVGAFADDRLGLAYVFTDCQVVLDDASADAFRAPSERQACALEKGAEATRARVKDADIVIFVASWRPWAAERLPATLKAYGLRPDQEVLVVGRKSFDGINLRRLVGADRATLAALRAEQTGSFRTATDDLRRLIPPEEFIDLQKIACGNGWACPIFTPEGHLISHDGSHLTRDGARWLGIRLFSDPRLARFLPQRQVALQAITD